MPQRKPQAKRWGQQVCLVLAAAQAAACQAWAPNQQGPTSTSGLAHPGQALAEPGPTASAASPKAARLLGSARAVLRPDGQGRYQLLQGEPGQCRSGVRDTSPTRYAQVRRWFDHPEETVGLAEEVTDGYIGGPFTADSTRLRLRYGLYERPGVVLPEIVIPPTTMALESITYTLYENGEILYEHHWYHPDGWNTANDYACLVGQPAPPADLQLQHPAFSPARPNRPGDGRKDTNRIQINAAAGWTLWVVGKNSPIKQGNGNSAWDWDGRLENGNLLADGAHTLRLQREGQEERTEQVLIDTKAPQLSALRVRGIEAHPAGGWVYQLEGQAQDQAGQAGVASGVVGTPGELLNANAEADPSATTGSTNVNGLLQVGVRFTGPSVDLPEQEGDQGKQLRYTLQVQDAAGNVDQAVGRFKAKLAATCIPVTNNQAPILGYRLFSLPFLFRLAPLAFQATHAAEGLKELGVDLGAHLMTNPTMGYDVHPELLDSDGALQANRLNRPGFHYRRQAQPYRFAVGLKWTPESLLEAWAAPNIRLPVAVRIRQGDRVWAHGAVGAVESQDQVHGGVFAWNCRQDNAPDAELAPQGVYDIEAYADTGANAEQASSLAQAGLPGVSVQSPQGIGAHPIARLNLAGHLVATQAEVLTAEAMPFSNNKAKHVLNHHVLADAPPGKTTFTEVEPFGFPRWERGDSSLAQQMMDPRWYKVRQMAQVVWNHQMPGFDNQVRRLENTRSWPIEFSNGLVYWCRYAGEEGTPQPSSFFPSGASHAENETYKLKFQEHGERVFQSAP